MTQSALPSGARSANALTRAGFKPGSPFRPGLRSYATVVLFTAFAGDFWRNLLSWYGFAAIVLALFGVAVWLIIKKKPLPRLTHLPSPLMLFVLWCLASVIWSAYRPETLLASVIQIMTVTVAFALSVNCTKLLFLDSLGSAMRAIVAMSLIFELGVALFIPQGILPLYLYFPGQLELFTGVAGATPETAHPAVYWSQGHLFQGAAIQGILGNRNLLGFVCLLALIVTGVQLASGRVSKRFGWIWCSIAFGTLFLSRSATPIVTLPVLVLAIALIWCARRLTSPQRWLMYLAVFVIGAIGLFVLVTWRDEIFGLVNRSGDMSGRGTVWQAVVGLGSQQPWIGIGWISYWAPWVDTFKQLVILDGLRYLQAHNAYLDAWMQTGIIGAVFFAGAVLSTTIRSWWLSIDKPQRDASGPRPIPHTSTAAFLLMVALVMQSLTESRLLVEGNFLLLSYLAFYTKLRVQDLPALPRRIQHPKREQVQRPRLSDTAELDPAIRRMHT